MTNLIEFKIHNLFISFGGFVSGTRLRKRSSSETHTFTFVNILGHFEYHHFVVGTPPFPKIFHSEQVLTAKRFSEMKLIPPISLRNI